MVLVKSRPMNRGLLVCWLENQRQVVAVSSTTALKVTDPVPQRETGATSGSVGIGLMVICMGVRPLSQPVLAL